MLPTGKDFFTAFAGVLLAEAVPVPLYPPFRLDRFEEYATRQTKILTGAAARLLITVEQGRSVGRMLRSRVPKLRGVVTVGDLSAEPISAPPIRAAADSPALIQYTSGSTGNPKGVLLSHHNLIANVRAIGQALSIQGDDVGVSWLPLYHDMGLIGCWMAPLYFGVPITILSPLSFLSRPERWLWAIHTHRATISPAPNFGYELSVRKIRDEALEGLDLSCWRAALNGAEPVSPETIDRFCLRFGPYGFRREAMMPVYGMAESTVALAIPPIDRGPRLEQVEREPFERDGLALSAEPNAESPHRFVSAGRPVKDHEVRIVDSEGKPVAERIEGTLEFRGPSAMQGYYRDEEATRSVSRPGDWWSSGDRAFLADGEIFVTGRTKDIIIRAGRNIYPQEVESIAEDVPGVRRGCVAAFGVKDVRQGTEKMIVVAETRSRSEEEKREIERGVAERLADLFGTPADDVVVVSPGTIPKTSSGKLRRSACRDKYLSGALTRNNGRSLLLLRLVAIELGQRATRFFRKMARWSYGVYALLLFFSTVLPVWMLALAVPSRDIASRVARFGASVYLFLSGCRLRVSGREHLVSCGTPVIFVSNHASYLDSIPLMAALSADYAFAVKQEVGSWPIFGTILRRLGHVLVDRTDPKSGVAGAESLQRTLEEGRSLFFFPEGTFTAATGLRPFKLGAFKLAADNKLPIVPIALVGTRRWLRDTTWLPRRSALGVVVEEPIRPRSADLSEVVRLRDETAERIARHTGEPKLDLVAAGLPDPDQEGDRR
jgi:1-acyl-sn-glycerol-3-phosphate acyltransferase